MPGVFALGQAALGQLPGNLPPTPGQNKRMILYGFSFDRNGIVHNWYIYEDGTQGPIIPPYGDGEF
jgi:hypothetical protein